MTANRTRKSSRGAPRYLLPISCRRLYRAYHRKAATSGLDLDFGCFVEIGSSALYAVIILRGLPNAFCMLTTLFRGLEVEEHWKAIYRRYVNRVTSAEAIASATELKRVGGSQ